MCSVRILCTSSAPAAQLRAVRTNSSSADLCSTPVTSFLQAWSSAPQDSFTLTTSSGALISILGVERPRSRTAAPSLRSPTMCCTSPETCCVENLPAKTSKIPVFLYRTYFVFPIDSTWIPKGVRRKGVPDASEARRNWKFTNEITFSTPSESKRGQVPPARACMGTPNRRWSF